MIGGVGNAYIIKIEFVQLYFYCARGFQSCMNKHSPNSLHDKIEHLSVSIVLQYQRLLPASNACS